MFALILGLVMILGIVLGVGLGVGLPAQSASSGSQSQDPTIVFKSPTFRPTNAPTSPTFPAPTLRPTQSPTFADAPILVFRSGVTLSSRAGIQAYDAACTSPQVQCQTTPRALVATAQRPNLAAFPEQFGFTGARRVHALLYSNEIVQFNSDWPSFVSNHGEYVYTIEDMGPPGAYYPVGPIGFRTDGFYDAPRTCSQWTVEDQFSSWYAFSLGKNSENNDVYSTSWIGKTDFRCEQVHPLCVCTGNYSATNPLRTSAPTRLPTHRPTSQAPTSQPTAPSFSAAPTATPTAVPTYRPTTRAPTTTPVRVFVDLETKNGALGNRATTTARCASVASSRSIPCARPLALLSYTSDSIRDMPYNYTFSPDSPVKFTTGATLGESWLDFLYPSSTLYAQGVFSNANDEYWTGSNVEGNTMLNCDNWTKNAYVSPNESGLGAATWASTSSTMFNEQATSACSELKHTLCLCLP